MIRALAWGLESRSGTRSQSALAQCILVAIHPKASIIRLARSARLCPHHAFGRVRRRVDAGCVTSGSRNGRYFVYRPWLCENALLDAGADALRAVRGHDCENPPAPRTPGAGPKRWADPVRALFLARARTANAPRRGLGAR